MRYLSSCLLILATLILLTGQAIAGTPGAMKWWSLTGTGTSASPAIGADGTVYLGDFDGHFYAFNASGAKNWTFSPGGNFSSSPTLGADGTIYVGNYDANLYAINPDGTQKWVASGAGGFSSPAIAADGTIYVGSDDDYLHAINPNGTSKWTFKAGDWVLSSPAIGTDGTIYVGACDGKVYAVNPDGTQKWAFTTGDWIESSPAIGADGTIYVGSDDSNIYAINPDGTQKWVFATEGWVPASPAIGVDGTIYIGSEDFNFYAINPDGTQKWVFPTNDYIDSSAAIASDGTIYFASNNGSVYALNADGTQKWVFPTGAWFDFTSPAVDAEGTIYVGGSKAYAIYGESTGLTDSPWPMFGNNLQHTSKAADANRPAITAPNGGETLTAGTTSSITWDASLEAVDFKLLLSTNGGTTWADIVTSTGNVRSATWTVPEVPFTKPNCLIKVQAYDLDGIFLGGDNSDAVFTIAPPPLEIASPNGGEILTGTKTATITWTSPPAAESFKLRYSMNGGTNWKEIDLAVGDVDFYVWTLPDVPFLKTNCLVKVQAYNAGGTFLGADVSDDAFAMTVAPTEVTSPNGGESFTGGTTQTITWNAPAKAVSFALRYSPNGGANWFLIDDTIGNVRSYQWTLPSYTNPKNAMLRIQAFNQGGWKVGEDDSDTVFVITP